MVTDSPAQTYLDEIAGETVARFVDRFGEPHRLLACHAALPLILTPELVSYLRSEFLLGQVPWVAEADLLLSELCRPVGHELYAMEASVKAYLVQRMRNDPQLGRIRMQSVARLLVHYVHFLSRTQPQVSDRELQSQQWAAMVYLDEHREQAAREIAGALGGVISPGQAKTSDGKMPISRTEAARLARLTQVLAPELEAYPELIEYAADVAQLLSVPSTATLQSLSSQSRFNKPSQVLGVNLPALKSLMPRSKSEAHVPSPSQKAEQGAPQTQTLNFPPRKVVKTLVVGQEVEGVVKRITAFGAFIDIGVGRDGLLHISEMSQRRVAKASDVVQEGEKVTVWIRELDRDKNRISLSMIAPGTLTMRDLEEGMVVTGRVTRMERYGAFLDIGVGRDGMLHVKEMGQGYVEKPEDVLKIGDEPQVMISGIDHRRGRIDLSIKKLLPLPSGPAVEATPHTLTAIPAQSRTTSSTSEAEPAVDFISPFEVAFQQAGLYRYIWDRQEEDDSEDKVPALELAFENAIRRDRNKKRKKNKANTVTGKQ